MCGSNFYETDIRKQWLTSYSYYVLYTILFHLFHLKSCTYTNGQIHLFSTFNKASQQNSHLWFRCAAIFFIFQNQGKTAILSVLPKTTPLWFPVMHLNDVVMASIFSFWKDSRINFIMIILQNRHGSKVCKM